MSRASFSSGRWQRQHREGGGRGQADLTPRGTPQALRRGSGYTGNRGTGHFQARGANRGRPDGAIFMQDRPATVDARIRDDSDMAVVALLNKQAGTGDDPQSDRLPLRPNFGTQGRNISLRANYFPINVMPEVAIYRYGAAIALSSERKVSRRVKHRVFQLAERTVEWQQAGMPGHVAHDHGERLVASIELPQPLFICGSYYEEEAGGSPSEGGFGYTLTLTFEEEVDQGILNDCLAGKPIDSQALAKVLSALNLIITALPSQTGVKIGRDDDTKKHPDQRLFFDNPEPKDIGGGLTVREGFYLSVRPAHQQLMVNVNTCHAAFYKPQNFVDALEAYSRFGGALHSLGRQVRVKTQPNGNIVTIQGISKQNARQHTFIYGELGRITIEKYYDLSENDNCPSSVITDASLTEHNITLQRPDLPLLEGPKGSRYPPEVCDIIPDQSFKGELTSIRHAKNMLDEACKLPRVNAKEIVNRGTSLLGFRDSNPVLDSFGVSVGSEMAVVPGRVLDKPGLSYSRGVAAIDDAASWNLKNIKFALGANLDNWAVLVIQDSGRDDFSGTRDPQLRMITDGFRMMCNKSGMHVQPLAEHACAEVLLPRSRVDRFRGDAIKQIEQVIRNLIQRAAPRLVLVVLSNDDKAIYNGLKWLCDIKLDIATVCMQSSKVRKDRGQQQYLANVALKVNIKLGGINHSLDANSGVWLKSASTMIMGMDVTHPGKMDGTPSIVAVVASVDEHFAQYPATLSLRKGGTEIVRGNDNDDNVLRDMFISRFELYKARNSGKLPERVILFRDGVSESQFMQVRQEELKQMKRAFDYFDSYQPKLSIIVCGKRHHTRFYPTQLGDAAHDGNPLPGTVVDRGVTPAYEFDFFLQAHGSLKGTARPTHYFVVHDENGFNADDLQRLTNDLSYMFARATKAVSLVSPAYWADIACERGRCYLYKLLHGDKAGDEPAKDDKGKKGKKRADRDPKDAVFEKALEMWGNGVSGSRLRDTMFYL